MKYLSLAALGLSVLATMSVQWLLDGTAPKRAVRWVWMAAGAAALVTYVVLAWVLIAPALPAYAFFRLAEWAHVPAPIQGAEFLLIRVRPLLTALLLKLIAGGFLLAIAASARREARLAMTVLCVFVVVDLLASNTGVNPTVDPVLLAEPAWLDHIPRDMHERVYVGGRLEGYINVFDVDAPKYASYLDGYNPMEQRFALVDQLLFNPSGAGIRESLSYDLPLLWPLEYARMIGYFRYASREERLRFLSRVGTRFVILPTPPYPGAKPLARLIAADQLQLYDLYPGARRTYVVPDAGLGPDVNWQIEGLFQERFDPSKSVLVSEPPPPPAGRPGPPTPASAVFVEDGLNRVVIRAGLPADGYLALLDTYSPDWHVDVDGTPATLMRANGLFRAVHLSTGTHTVTFVVPPDTILHGGGALRGDRARPRALVFLGRAPRAPHAGGRADARLSRSVRVPRVFWTLLPLAASLVPAAAGLATTNRIFYVRDLSLFFWSRHLWLRETLLSGQAPWWNPFVAGGQSAIADALVSAGHADRAGHQGLPSDVVSFNLWVAAPLPIAALGTFVFLRSTFTGHHRRHRRAAAAFGACVFVLSGPVVSMLNTPNLAWSVAFMPWVLARRRSRAWTGTAMAFGLQGLCGEPVTWAATGVLALAQALFDGGDAEVRLKADATDKAGATDGRRRVVSAFRRTFSTAMGLAVGGLLASVQIVPTAVAVLRAHRAVLATPDFWSLHPLSLWETVAPHLFGNYYDALLANLPWMPALNFGRDPFFYSIYVGSFVLLAAAFGAVAGPRARSLFWTVVVVVFTLAALGGYTPLYPALRRLAPALLYFRFPVKYLVFAVFGCAVLAAEGWAAAAEGFTSGGARRYAAATAVVMVLGAHRVGRSPWLPSAALADRARAGGRHAPERADGRCGVARARRTPAACPRLRAGTGGRRSDLARRARRRSAASTPSRRVVLPVRVRRPDGYQLRPQPDDAGEQGVAAGVVHLGGGQSAPLRRRPRPRLHEYARSRCSRHLDESRAGAPPSKASWN